MQQHKEKLIIKPIFKKIGNMGIEHLGNVSFKSRNEDYNLEVWINSHGHIVYQIAELYQTSTQYYNQIQNKYVFFKDIQEIDILRGLFR